MLQLTLFGAVKRYKKFIMCYLSGFIDWILDKHAGDYKFKSANNEQFQISTIKMANTVTLSKNVTLDRFYSFLTFRKIKMVFLFYTL